MRLKQYCCMLVAGFDVEKSKGQVQDQGRYQTGSGRQPLDVTDRPLLAMLPFTVRPQWGLGT